MLISTIPVDFRLLLQQNRIETHKARIERPFLTSSTFFWSVKELTRIKTDGLVLSSKIGNQSFPITKLSVHVFSDANVCLL